MRRRLLIPAVFLLLLIVLTLVLGEIAVRSLVWLGTPYGSVRFRQYDAALGLSLVPGVQGQHARGCFKGTVSINAWGMRDRSRTLAKPDGVYRIALLGDSIIEGVHVAPDEVANIRLERALADDGLTVEVLNFGVASIGTTQELLKYRRDVKRFDPDLVVVLFYADNDVMNNSSELQPRTYGEQPWYAPYFDLGEDGELEFTEVQPRDVSLLRRWLEDHSLLVHYLERMLSSATRGDESWQGLSLPYGVYGHPPKEEWARAWEVTRRVLQTLHEEVTADGRQFLVMLLPLFYDIDPDWERALGGEQGLPDAFKPVEVTAELKAHLGAQGIAFADLGPHFTRYRVEHALAPPYFSLPCDSHFSVLGHEVLAGAMRQILDERGFPPR